MFHTAAQSAHLNTAYINQEKEIEDMKKINKKLVQLTFAEGYTKNADVTLH